MAGAFNGIWKAINGLAWLSWIHVLDTVDARVFNCSEAPSLQELRSVVFPEHAGRTVWSPCDYPNPRVDYERCRLTEPGWFCDPDRILRDDQVVEMQEKLAEVLAASHCRCESGCTGDTEGHPIVVLIMEWMRIADLSGRAGYCKATPAGGSSCEVRFPQLEPGSRDPTLHEWESASRWFGEQVRNKWKLSTCQDEVVIVISKKYKKMFISAGDVAKGAIGEEVISEVEQLVNKHVVYGSIKTSAILTLTHLHPQLDAPSRAGLVVGIVFILLLLIIILFVVAIIVTFCVLELRQGKSMTYVCNSLAGGEWVALFTDRTVLNLRQASEDEKEESAEEPLAESKEDGVGTSPSKDKVAEKSIPAV